uniref:Uncharacterized protein n=1 Tax=Anguilla anguilla TaxID=7936 RepID=A0A0E9SL96_ANGAN
MEKVLCCNCQNNLLAKKFI